MTHIYTKGLRSAALCATALVTLTAGAQAGGIDRSGQSNAILFEDGNLVEFSIGSVSPDVSGTYPANGANSGQVGESYLQLGFGVKQDLTDKLSIALYYDQPYGADVSYEDADLGYPIMGTTAELNSEAANLMLRYKFTDRIAMHGGLRYESIEGTVGINSFVPGVGYVDAYTLDTNRDYGTGYSIGASYEIPEIALRASITYNSKIEHTLEAEETAYVALFGANVPLGSSEFTSHSPQSVNIDFQTGIMADTLLMASARWVNWSDFEISPANYDELVSYDEDTWSYTLGVGRKFSDSFAGSFSIGYEKSGNGTVSNLGPTDGYWSAQIGGQYTMDKVKISGGLRYVMIGDATTNDFNAEFEDNHAIALGLKVAYAF
ncbi:Outer membrane protein transport protein (OMPP1/FadL/TodX) [Aquimixticola soesokkakensis]|uniref:Outer membrane protein transport protein (OMPP1/FadL/TodX) n=1 Tax=Aquimixticola soesokkakensis TaxID=1519096 RepID=A0A1Y5SNM9_9RHOB|nr:outer membrane protein transport protein [Aquimixticola soesokkakensis]SLN41880.1 Outer membrane protein transport protein (OMPP1/FadL/TodX) [Aquimixticola soesokkakensis]